jgi:hypothetical protein
MRRAHVLLRMLRSSHADGSSQSANEAAYPITCTTAALSCRFPCTMCKDSTSVLEYCTHDQIWRWKSCRQSTLHNRKTQLLSMQCTLLCRLRRVTKILATHTQPIELCMPLFYHTRFIPRPDSELIVGMRNSHFKHIVYPETTHSIVNTLAPSLEI